jgi:catechol 2,3-dioxygenase-like lactoylglutathione lyase family enzyme
MIERYSFVAITTLELERARRFWTEALSFPVTEERPGDYFIVNAGGLRLCVDLADGQTHREGSSDPIIGLKVASVREALERLAPFGIIAHNGPTTGPRGTYAEIREPDGRTVILTEAD